ncbi:hypothetical protein ACHWQZ_G001085 [Mnemiopsis leidyi]
MALVLDDSVNSEAELGKAKDHSKPISWCHIPYEQNSSIKLYYLLATTARTAAVLDEDYKLLDLNYKK